MTPPTALFGLMAEFESAEQVIEAARRARAAGYRHMDAYTPYAVDGLAAELGLLRTEVPFIVLVAGLVGAGAPALACAIGAAGDCCPANAPSGCTPERWPTGCRSGASCSPRRR